MKVLSIASTILLLWTSVIHAVDRTGSGSSSRRDLEKGSKGPKGHKGGKGGNAKKILQFQQPNGNIFVPVDPSVGNEDVPGWTAILDINIYEEDRTSVVGQASGSCIRIRSGLEGIWHCTYTYELPAGDTLTVSYSFTEGRGEAHAAVVGGTGAYNGMIGQADIVGQGDWNFVTISLRTL